jgi:hypothetical protein
VLSLLDLAFEIFLGITNPLDEAFHVRRDRSRR